VVGGRSGGTTDSVVDQVTGFLVNPQDVDELASVLKRLLQNAELRQVLGQQGMNRARNEFNWKTRGQRLREISTAIVHGRRLRDVRAPEPIAHPVPLGKIVD
jgi:glycosyltransferase involved in cell wall biosynthesis